MPAKKTKKTTAKKPVKKKTSTAKKKTRASSRAPKKKPVQKKKTASKKAPAKKKVSSKKAPKKKATSKAKKKTVKKTETRQVVANPHATQVHHRQSQLSRQEKPAPPIAFEVPKKFSFQDALSQVRGQVHHREEPIAPPVQEYEEVELNQENQKEISPYILDLKRGLTVTGAFPLHQKKQESLKLKQEALDLFKAPEENLFKRTKVGIESFFAPLFKQKQINLAPLEHKYLPGRASRRFLRRLRWKLSRLGSLITYPFENLQDRRRQRAFNLSHGHLATKRIKPIVTTSRNGNPIEVKQFAGKLHALKRRRAENGAKRVRPLRPMLSKQEKRFLPSFSHLSFSRAVIPFALIGLLISSPFLFSSLGEYYHQAEGEVMGATNYAVQRLQVAGNNAKTFNFLEAGEEFAEAGRGFEAAGALLKNQYGKATKALSLLPFVGQKLDSAESLLSAGSKLSAAATLLSQGFAVFADDEHFLADQPLSYKLQYLFVRIEEARPAIEEANQILASVDRETLPDEMRADVETLQKALPQVEKQFTQFDHLSEALLAFMGHDTLQRHLVLFQNNTELRATGGFMGSLALVDIDRGEMKNIEIPGGGPYDFQGSLFEQYKAPRALQLINPRLELQDANWFFDYATSAKKVSSLYEKAGGPSVDSVIAINTDVLAELLQFVGPVELPEYGTVISAENFREILQNHVEFEYDKELNQPKKIIGDLAPLLLEEIKQLSPEEYVELAGVFGNLLAQRDILIYDRHEETQAAFRRLGWTGEIVDTETDYLAVVHTNLAGGKTDGVMKDTFDLSVHLNAQGKSTHTLTIQRKHEGQKGVPLIGVRNVDYLRVYVPKGAKLISAEGFQAPPEQLFETPPHDWKDDEDILATEGNITLHESGTEIYQEGGKTVFANWIQVDPGQESRVTLVYETENALSVLELPSREASWIDWFTGETAAHAEAVRPYQLYWQKQSGSWDPQLSVKLNYPVDWQVRTNGEYAPQTGTGSWKAQSALISDKFFSFLFY